MEGSVLKIDDDFTIVPAEYSWDLKLERNTGVINPKTGKEMVTRKTWYCASIPDAIRRYVTEAGKQADSMTDLVEVLSRIEKTIGKIKI